MIERKLKGKIITSLRNYPVVSIIGSRQVGKTTLARLIADEIDTKTIYLDLELPSDINKLENAELYLKNYPDNLIIIDEVQRKPELFPLIRSLVDLYKRNGCFLILGSASPALKRQAAESLAGRIIYHELQPLLFEETGYLKQLWLRGGYPLSFLADTDELSYEWRHTLITTYLERDIPQLGIRVPAIQLRRFWQMIAHAHGQIWNASKIASSLGVSAPTIKHYLDILNDTFIIRQLLPYFPNIKKRLIKSQKIYIRDCGLLHALLNINNLDDLFGHSSAGMSWEGMIVEQIFGMTPANCELYFYRTSAGAEMDIVLITGNNAPVSIEIKRTLKPSLSKGFNQAFSDIKSNKGYIIYPGDEKYPLAKNVDALPASRLSEIFEPDSTRL